MARKNIYLFILVIVLYIIIAGCQPKEFNEPGVIKQSKENTSRAYHSNFQDTWNAVAQAANKNPVVSASKETGTIITDWIKSKSDRLYSGYGETRIPYTIRYKFTIKVKPASKGTMVNITSKEQYLTDSVTSGIDFSGSIYQWLDTESSTLKEAAFLDDVEKQISPIKK